jgi:predicted lysophospholipase L1 biosynthesis ABC-type transport system permease subunit
MVPTGTAGRLEPPGIRVEPLVLIGGAAAVLAVLAAAGGLLALRITAHAPKVGRAQPASGSGPLPLRLGLHWTFSRSNPGPATVSARAALMAVAVGVAGITAVVTFAASLNHLVDTPRLHGWTFDVSFGSSELDRPALEKATHGLADDPRVEALAWATIADIPAGPGALEVYALDQARGEVHPTILEGRAPVGSDEIAAGSEALASVGLHVGDRVRLGPDGVPFRIVGRAVYPELGNNGDLANAGSITADGLERLGAEPLSTLALVRLRDGTDVKAFIARHKAQKMEAVTPFLPPRIRNIRAVGGLPWLMAGFLAAVALVAVGHALALSVRGRRHDLAVLRALGAVRRQVAAAVWSQASITVVAGSLVGIPIGIAVGRVSWGLVANGLGVLDRPVLAWAILGMAAGGLLAGGNLLATGPALVASRLRPAAILRSE